MFRLIPSTAEMGAAVVAFLSLVSATTAHAAGVLYADPGWIHAYEGDEAFYNDPDGPHPDYVNGSNDNTPGGQGGTAALIDPGLDGNGNVDNANAKWLHSGQQWEGSAPGDPLGGPFGPPPVPPPAPGGVATYTGVDSTTFLRLQNPGLPGDWGWPDKGAQACPTCAQQEGNNRRMLFSHPMDRDDGFSGQDAMIDNGITVSFRVRLATAATGPIDEIYVEGGPSVSPGGQPVAWPDDGLGFEVHGNGRGMFMITQTAASGTGQQMAFSLLDQNTITFEGLAITQTGLVTNNRANPAGGNSVNTNDATEETLNIVEIDHAELVEWHEFWITVSAIELDGSGNPIPDADGNTHEMNVYRDGSLVPETRQLVLSLENEFVAGAHLGMGLSSDSRIGAFDVDFFTYTEGIVEPTLAQLFDDADFNEDGNVNGDDFLLWQNGLGIESGAVKMDGDADDDGDVDGDDFLLWQSQFGTSGGDGSGAAVPEPAAAALLLCLVAPLAVRRPRSAG